MFRWVGGTMGVVPYVLPLCARDMILHSRQSPHVVGCPVHVPMEPTSPRVVGPIAADLARLMIQE